MGKVEFVDFVSTYVLTQNSSFPGSKTCIVIIGYKLRLFYTCVPILMILGSKLDF